MRPGLLFIVLTFLASAETVHYTYDQAGRLTRAEYERGKAISYTYDLAGNLLKREVTESSGGLSSKYAASYQPSGVLAPEAIAFGEGSGLATDTTFATDLPTELFGTSIDVMDSQGVSRKAGLFYVTPMYTAYVVPAGTALGPGKVIVHSGAGGVPDRASSC